MNTDRYFKVSTPLGGANTNINVTSYSDIENTHISFSIYGGSSAPFTAEDFRTNGGSGDNIHGGLETKASSEAVMNPIVPYEEQATSTDETHPLVYDATTDTIKSLEVILL